MYKYDIIGTPADYSDVNNWYKIPDVNDMKHDVDILYFIDWKLWGEEVKGTFGPESYHGADFSFFYYNIRENAKVRVKKWFEKRKEI